METCGALAAAWLGADGTMIRAAVAHTVGVRGSSSPRWRVLDADQAADVDAICATIIPSGATPGAHEAGAVHFVDYALDSWAAFQRGDLLDGLRELNARVEARWPGARHFSVLTPSRRIEMLRLAESSPFFWGIRFLTIVGMFALPTYGGNAAKTGWRLIGFDDRYRWTPPFGAYDAAHGQSR